jgi:hypothetical protein
MHGRTHIKCIYTYLHAAKNFQGTELDGHTTLPPGTTVTHYVSMVTLYHSSDNELEDTPYKSGWQAAVLFIVPAAFHRPQNFSYEYHRFCDLNANE